MELRQQSSLGCPVGKKLTCSVSNQCASFNGEIDIAKTLLARDYKGFGNQPMNGVIEK